MRVENLNIPDCLIVNIAGAIGLFFGRIVIRPYEMSVTNSNLSNDEPQHPSWVMRFFEEKMRSRENS